MENSIQSLILLVLLFDRTSCITNYVANGAFQIQSAPNGSDIPSGAIGWNGTLYQVMNKYRKLGHGQYIDLQFHIGENGYIEQIINLPKNGNYTLEYYQQAYTANYSLHVMEIYWNGQLQATKIANTTNTTFQSLTLFGIQGSNLLKFAEIGDDSDNHGMFIDEVSLTEIVEVFDGINQTNSTQIADENGIQIQEQFAIKNATVLDFSIISNLFSMSLNLPISNYLSYTRDRFVEIQGTSSILIETAFPFLIYTNPRKYHRLPVSICSFSAPTKISDILKLIFHFLTFSIEMLKIESIRCWQVAEFWL